MKHNQNHDNAIKPTVLLKPVQFEFIHPTAAKVCVAGSFNQWHPTTKPMDHLGDGRWFKETTLAPGTYEYCLVVDGAWIPDPRAKEHVRNPYGGQNSVLRVATSREADHLSHAENSPLENANQSKKLIL